MNSKITIMTNKTNNTSQVTKTSRAVGFETRTKVILVKSLSDFTDAEIDAAWTTPEEHKASLDDIAKNVKAMRSNATEDESLGLCYRGLETMKSVTTLHETKSNKETHIDLILDEQDRQWENDQIDHKRIAKISQISSERTRRHAVLRAGQDNNEISAYARTTTS